MALSYSLAEIVKMVREAPTKKEKIELLRKHDSIHLRQVLICLYDTERIKFLVPNVAPPYNPSAYPDSFGLLYHQLRKLRYIIEGEAPTNITQLARERIFIQMLETVHPDDAELLCRVIEQKPLTGLTVSVINEALGDIITKSLETPKKARKNAKTV